MLHASHVKLQYILQENYRRLNSLNSGGHIRLTIPVVNCQYYSLLRTNESSSPSFMDSSAVVSLEIPTTRNQIYARILWKPAALMSAGSFHSVGTWCKRTSILTRLFREIEHTKTDRRTLIVSNTPQTETIQNIKHYQPPKNCLSHAIAATVKQ